MHVAFYWTRSNICELTLPYCFSGSMGGAEYLESVRKDKDCYPGFNLIVGDMNGLFIYSNRDPEDRIEKLGIGSTVGLTNTLLQNPWFKSQHGIALVNSISIPDPDVIAKIASDDDFSKFHAPPSPEMTVLLSPLTEILENQTGPADMPAEVTQYDLGGYLAPIFVPPMVIGTSEAGDILYGTRCSIIILVDKENRVTFYERALDTETKKWSSRVFHFVANTSHV